MVNSSETTRADIVLTGLQDTKCFTSWQDFLQELPNLISVAVPNNITNVIVSNIQPTSSQTTDIWFRTSNSGSFLGIYVFSQGAWHQIYPVNVDGPIDTTQIFWFQGDPNNPPAGWTNTNVATIVDPTIATALAALWVTGSGGLVYYSAVFTGF